MCETHSKDFCYLKYCLFETVAQIYLDYHENLCKIILHGSFELLTVWPSPFYLTTQNLKSKKVTSLPQLTARTKVDN